MSQIFTKANLCPHFQACQYEMQTLPWQEIQPKVWQILSVKLDKSQFDQFLWTENILLLLPLLLLLQRWHFETWWAIRWKHKWSFHSATPIWWWWWWWRWDAPLLPPTLLPPAIIIIIIIIIIVIIIVLGIFIVFLGRGWSWWWCTRKSAVRPTWWPTRWQRKSTERLFRSRKGSELVDKVMIAM